MVLPRAAKSESATNTWQSPVWSRNLRDLAAKSDSRSYLPTAAIIMVTFIRHFMKADNIVKRNRMDREDRLATILLWKDNPIEIITYGSKNSTRATQSYIYSQ